jgi:3-oxoacyl-[acyl-carrier-protein] synthase-1
MQPLVLSASTLTSCLGTGVAATLEALRGQRSGLARCRFETAELDAWIGEVARLDDEPIDGDLAAFDCRNNRLAARTLAADGFESAVAAAAARHGADRIGVFVGTSTSGILQTELAYRRRGKDGALPPDFHYAGTHNSFSVADYTRRRLGLGGPAVAVSAACASSAKVFGNAARMIAAGLIDAAVVGGVDSLCLTTLYGFNSLELISQQPCRPFDTHRDGISIGEAGGFALLESIRSNVDPAAVLVAGIGESSDAYHMSSPHPEGAGARAAMVAALDAAGIAAADVDYINLHGTGTPSNDAAEDHAVHAIFGDRVPVSSTKGATGHALGAAGIVEALIVALAIRHNLAPAGLNTREIDPALKSRYLLGNLSTQIDIGLSNSFGFGGANCALVLGRADRLPRVRVVH